MPYSHQRADWPKFYWHREVTNPLLGKVRHAQGKLLGKMTSMSVSRQEDALLQTLTQDVLKTSEIEGIHLDREQISASIASRLGMDIGALAGANRAVDGVVELMLDATQRFSAPLTKERLFAWHGALFPTGRSAGRSIKLGTWRTDEDGPMQVVSANFGRATLHFEAPPADTVPQQMDEFLNWFEHSSDLDAVEKAAIAHLWFVTIHPFDDGNGRIARAIGDMALARSEHSTRKFYSLCAHIQAESTAYYEVLEHTQKGSLDCTDWMVWFLNCLSAAIDSADSALAGVPKKHAYWEAIENENLTTRQRILLNHLLESEDGSLTTKQAAQLTNASHDTALRDIENLIYRRLIQKQGAARSTSYVLSDLPM